MSFDAIGESFPANQISVGYTFKSIVTGGEYEYIGGDPLLDASWKLTGGNLSSDPNTSQWGSAQVGAQWFNTTDAQAKLWNGIEIVLMG